MYSHIDSQKLIIEENWNNEHFDFYQMLWLSNSIEFTDG